MAPAEPIWACPVCDGRLARQEARFLCPEGHSFDVAREGYVNLVLARDRRSPAAGDPKDSLRHRRAFLEAGHYAPLAAALAELLRASSPDRVLDAGCGEGWYLRQLADLPDLAQARLYGVDVAREAVRLAARAAPASDFAVGNNFRLPVATSSVAAVLQVFAPSAPDQVRRVLRPEGRYLEVKPGPRHLEGLRGLVYERPQPHAEPVVPEGFAVERRESIAFGLALDRAEDVAGLVEMTPYKWHMNPETYSRVRDLTRLDDTAQFAVTVYQPTGDGG